MKPGKRNLITDVPGLRVGNAQNASLKTGVTVLTADKPFLANVDIMGGAPGTRETDCLVADNLVSDVDAIVLSGGSAFGLDAASGVTDALAETGVGFKVGPVTVPIVPAAIIFDLLNGGEQWKDNPYNQLGREAFAASTAQTASASSPETNGAFDLGTAGAGVGATTANLKGGLGSASIVLPSGHTVGALIVVNPHGSVIRPGSNQFWAAPFEVDNEFGGLGLNAQPQPLHLPLNEKLASYQAKANTTIGIVATDAILDKAQAKRFAVAAQDGMARSIVPAHTLFDGDLLFGVSTRQKPLVDANNRQAGDAGSASSNTASSDTDAVVLQMLLGHAASLCVARAVARAVYLAQKEPNDIMPSWQSLHGK